MVFKKGYVMSEDHKKKIGDSNRRKIHSKEQNLQHSKNMEGFMHTEKTKVKISNSLEGHPVSIKTRSLISESNTGQKRSESTKNAISTSKTQHGLSKHPQFNRWNNMMRRCYNVDSEKYKNYGGRGISVHLEWHDVRNFILFLESGLTVEPPYMGLWFSSEPPDGYSLDRINVNGNYEPGNIRWASSEMQSSNKVKLTVCLDCGSHNLGTSLDID